MMLARVALNTTGLGPCVTVTCPWRVGKGRRWVQWSDVDSRAWLCRPVTSTHSTRSRKEAPRPDRSYAVVNRLPWWLRWCRICNVGDVGSVPGLGRFPGEGHGNSLQYSCLENSMDRGAWQATVTKSQTQLSDFHFHLQPSSWGWVLQPSSASVSASAI